MSVYSFSDTVSIYSRLQKGNLSQFHIKLNELYLLKSKASTQLKAMNRLKMNYIDWFQKRNQTFLDAVKTMQVTSPLLLPQEIKNFGDFLRIYEMAQRKFHRGYPVTGLDQLEQMLSFWIQFQNLFYDLQTVYMDTCDYCNSISRLRQPEIKDEIDGLYRTMNHNYSEKFDFRFSHDERRNLFTYKLMVCDQRYMGLVGYIPYLLSHATRLCYLIGKLHIEKE